MKGDDVQAGVLLFIATASLKLNPTYRVDFPIAITASLVQPLMIALTPLTPSV